MEIVAVSDFFTRPVARVVGTAAPQLSEAGTAENTPTFSGSAKTHNPAR